MTRPEARRAAAAFDQVRAVLHGEWDPIGCAVPIDEYDSYAWRMLDLLQKKAAHADVEAYLRWAADEAMRSPVPEDRLASVVNKLMALDLD